MVNYRLLRKETAGLPGDSEPESRQDRFIRHRVLPPFDHVHRHGGEHKRGIKRIPVVTRYCCQLRIYPLILPSFPSGQNSTQGWSASPPQTSSSPSLPNSPCPLTLNRVKLGSGEWPQLREMIKYKIKKVRRATSPSCFRLTGIRLQEH